jgi:hypothetical protein
LSSREVVDPDVVIDEQSQVEQDPPRLRLVALSFLMLFLELALIRWTGSNNVHLAYLTNFVLLASFLGIGIGFLRAKTGPDLFPYTPVALALLVVFVRLFPVKLVALSGPDALEGTSGWRHCRAGSALRRSSPSPSR